MTTQNRAHIVMLAIAFICLLACTAPPKPGLQPAKQMDFRLPSLSGESTHSLSSYRGRPVLVDFWATWCAPCHKTLPELVRMGRKHPGIAILAVSLDEDVETARRFALDIAPDLRLLHDPGKQAAESFAIRGMPAAVLIDAEGRMVQRWDGYTQKDLREMDALMASTRPGG